MVHSSYQLSFILEGVLFCEGRVTAGKDVVLEPIGTSQTLVMIRVANWPAKEVEVVEYAKERLRVLLACVGFHSASSMPVFPTWAVTKKVTKDESLKAEEQPATRIQSASPKKVVPSDLEKGLGLFNNVTFALQDKRNRYISVALSYYYYALTATRPHEGIVNAMISLESLLSEKGEDLTFRVSSRTALLLAPGDESLRTKVFQDLIDLYDVRSKIVHGSPDSTPKNKDFSLLMSYTKEALAKMLSFSETSSREEILGLLDQALLSDAARTKLAKT